MGISAQTVKELAGGCGFELVGIAPAAPLEDFERFEAWRSHGFAGEMTYLTDRRGDLRSDPRNLLPTARSMVCVGKLYNADLPHSTELQEGDRGWISRYAWGADYHDVMRAALEHLIEQIRLHHREAFDSRICVDTAPLLERSYAHAAGLGWIGRNTCLINQGAGSWFFLGEVLLSMPLATDKPAPNRCGSCTRCIEACPTEAIVPGPDGSWSLDARLCISYLTIEKRGEIPPELGSSTANHLFGCDICQDVCPWNRKAPTTAEEAFLPREFAPSLERLSLLSEQEFRNVFRHSPVWRARYEGFLRSVALAMGNSGRYELERPLQRLSEHANAVVASTAAQALEVWKKKQNRKQSICDASKADYCAPL